MSRFVAGLVYQKRIGSMARKAILAYCAERANDDGSGIWASKVRIAKEVECTKKTIIETMRSFVSEGLLIETGKRRTSNGFVVEYQINVAAVKALPDAIEDVFSTDDQSPGVPGSKLNQSPDYTPRGVPTTPQEVYPLHPNRPLTVLKPSNSAREKEPSLFSEYPTPEKKPNVAEMFERFWKVYPKKEGRKKASENFARAIKAGADPEAIIAGARRYASACVGQDSKFIKWAQGWLTEERWNDGPPQEELTPAQIRLRAILGKEAAE